MDLHTLSITQALEGLKAKKFSSVELTESCLNQIESRDTDLNAFVTVTKESALEQAQKADDDTNDYPLRGIPIAIKDNFSTTGIATSASSKILKDYIPPYDATVVKKLKDAGMVMLGKTNMDAWAHGSSTETSDFGPTKNPHDLSKLPGGSSGGTAAAVGAHETIGGIGSETAGSIRQPAAWCGIVGLKPSYGRVSRYGVIAMASSLDSPGPMTKTVKDSAILLNVIAGHDPHDGTSSSKSIQDYTANLDKPVANITIGYSDDYFPEGIDEQVRQHNEKAIQKLEKLGIKVKKISLFNPKYAISVYTILQRSEVSSNLARLDGIRYGLDRSNFGEEAKRRIMLGTYALSAGYYDAYYKKAQQVRTKIIQDFEDAFKDVDLIIAPTSPSLALPVGSSKNDPMFGEIADMLVEPSSIAGLPGINIPVGFSKENLPVGMQIIGPMFSEEHILNLAHQYELAYPWNK